MNNKLKRNTFAYYIFALTCLVFISCGMRKANIYNGTLQVYSPIIHYGNSKPLIQGHNSEISVGVAAGENQTLKLNGLNNDSYLHEYYDGRYDSFLSLPDSSATISYRLVQFLASITGAHYIQKNHWFIGGKLGLSPFPFVSPTIGFNTSHFEMGGSASLGIFANEVYLEGHRVNQMWDGRDKSEDYTIDESKYWHMYNDVNVFSNLYYKGLCIGYSGTIAFPYGVYRTVNGYDISFHFPYLISNKVGVGYNLNQKFARIGLGQITGRHFSGRFYSIHFTVGTLL